MASDDSAAVDAEEPPAVEAESPRDSETANTLGVETTDPQAATDDLQKGFWDRISVIALGLLTVAWAALLVTRLTAAVTAGTAVGAGVAVALAIAGCVGVARHGTGASGRLLAGGLFVVGGVAMYLSVTIPAGTVANDAVTAVTDVAILSGLLVVLGLQTETGREALAG